LGIKGIDVNEYQGDMDWDLVFADGIEFVMVRASLGPERIDKNFFKNATEALKNCIHVGAYHYCHARDVNAAKKEALHFINTVKGRTMTYPLALYLEDDTLKELGSKVLTNIAVMFLETLAEFNYFPMICSSSYWFDHVLDDQRLRKYHHWTKFNGDKNDYTGTTGIWQCSKSGRVNGIESYVDLNRSNIDYSLLIRFLGLNNLRRSRLDKFYVQSDKIKI